MNTCSLPSTGGIAGITLALIFLAAGALLVLLVRRSPARLSVIATVPLVAGLGLTVAPTATECASLPAAATTVSTVATTTDFASTTSTPGQSSESNEVPTTERYSDDLKEQTLTWRSTTLPPAPTVTTTWPPSPTTRTPSTPGPTSTIVPGATTTLRPAARPPLTWAPYLMPTTIERDLEYDD